MATINTITEFLDNLYTTTWQNRQEGISDNIFQSTAFFFWLKDKGKLIPVRGGRYIEENLEYAANPNIAWVGRGGIVSLNDYQFMTVAQYQWRYVTASIVRFGVDDQQNSGQAQIMSLMNQKMGNSEQSLITEMETQLCGGPGTVTANTTTAAAPAIDGIKSLVADDPTTSSGGNGISPGGIDSSQSQFSWWRNQTKNMTGISFATSGVSNMRTMLNNCMNNRKMDRPDILLSDQTTYENYEAASLGFYRITNNKLADNGFENQTFKGIPMVWTPAISQRMYFLNTNFISFKYDPAYNFNMTEWKPIPNQVNDRAAQIILAGQLVTNRRRVLGVMYNLNTA
jgi:hypothetical protein